MSKKCVKRPETITDRFIHTVCARLEAGKRVRRNLPGWGRVHIDRPLPFLCIYRRPPRRKDTGTDLLVTSEAAYLTASGTSGMQPGLSSLVRSIARTMAGQYGAFLVVEIGSGDWNEEETQDKLPGRSNPGFRLLAPPNEAFDDILESFEIALSRITLAGLDAEVRIQRTARCAPGRLPRSCPRAKRSRRAAS